MKGRHIKSMVRRRLSDFIKVEDAKVGRKNVLAVSGMIGASALGALLLGIAQKAFASVFTTTHYCPWTVTLDNGITLTVTDHSGFCYDKGPYAKHACTYPPVGGSTYIAIHSFTCDGCIFISLTPDYGAVFKCLS